MSNATIIAIIKSEIAAYERKERNAESLCAILGASFEALEGISYQKLTSLRDFESLIIKAQFSDEEYSDFEPYESVSERLKSALDEIEKNGA